MGRLEVRDELPDLLVGVLGDEGAVIEATLEVAGTGVLLVTAHDVGPAVRPKDGSLVAKLAGLGHDVAVVLVVVRRENRVGLGGDDGRELPFEVDVTVGISLLGGDGDAVGLGLLDKGVIDTLLVGPAGVIDGTHRLVASLGCEVCQELALVGIGDAGAKRVGSVGDEVRSRRRGRDDRHVVIDGGLGNRNRGRRCHVTDDADDTVLDHLVVDVLCLGGVALLVLGVELDLLAVGASLVIELRDIELCTRADGKTVLGDVARVGSHDTDLDGVGVSSGARRRSTPRKNGCATYASSYAAELDKRTPIECVSHLVLPER